MTISKKDSCMGEPRPEGFPKQGQNLKDYRDIRSKILFTRGIIPKVQLAWVTSRSNLNQGHVKHRIYSTPHIWEVRGTPFNLNVKAYNKVVSWGTSLISIFFHENTG